MVIKPLSFVDNCKRADGLWSRYAGPGSHRYPVDWDTIVTWESLHFQPYFTSTAS